MAGYDPKRLRPTQGADIIGLPGDPAPASDPPAPVIPNGLVDPDPTPEPTRRALPRPSPPLDRALPPAALAGMAASALVLLLMWRRYRRDR